MFLLSCYSKHRLQKDNKKKSLTTQDVSRTDSIGEFVHGVPISDDAKSNVIHSSSSNYNSQNPQTPYEDTLHLYDWIVKNMNETHIVKFQRDGFAITRNVCTEESKKTLYNSSYVYMRRHKNMDDSILKQHPFATHKQAVCSGVTCTFSEPIIRNFKIIRTIVEKIPAESNLDFAEIVYDIDTATYIDNKKRVVTVEFTC